MEWLKELRPKALRFLDIMKGKRQGFFKYSLTGDFYNEDVYHWGLGNTVFAVKIYYMLNGLDVIDGQTRNACAAFIKSFQNKKGEIYDPTVQKTSFILRMKDGLLHGQMGNICNHYTRRAETRQAIAALMCLEDKPEQPYCKDMPYSRRRVKRYLESLNWRCPWGAASHFSHLLFFLRANEYLFGFGKGVADQLINYAIEFLSHYKSTEDGSWYEKGAVIPPNQKINAAMKVITGLQAVNRTDVVDSKRLIDLCLSNSNDEHACNNLDIIYVLYNCNKLNNYRSDEINRFCHTRIKYFRRFYWPEYGGFSFFPGRANDVYYNARISKGLKEPDIHGTVLFLWGIALIGSILEIDTDLGLRQPIT